MPSVFANSRGVVSRVSGQFRGGGVLPFAIRMDGMDVGGSSNATTRAIITQGTLMEEGIHQFNHTLQESIYVYSFGDWIGQIRVGGLAFAELCIQEASSVSNETGIEQVIRNYREHKLSTRGRPVILTFGVNNPFRAFLLGMNIEIVDPERMIAQWTYQFKAFPGRGD